MIKNCSKTLFFVIILVIILAVIGTWIFLVPKKKKAVSRKNSKISMPGKVSKKKTAVMIIAFRDFKDEEYFLSKEVLEKAGVEIVTASDELGTAIGASGAEAEVDLFIENLTVENFDAIIFIGGPGALKHLDNEVSYNIAQEALSRNKVLGAICISPVILAKAGVLKEKKATVWSDALDKSPIRILENNGAIYDSEDVVIDGKIVTANGPAVAEAFGEALVEILQEK